MVNAKSVLRDPPFRVSEKGYGGFTLPIEIHFRTNCEPRKAKFEYDLYLQSIDSAPIFNVRKEKLTFLAPNEEFKKKLLQGGGTEVSSSEDSRVNEKSSKSRPSSGAKVKPFVRHHQSSSYSSSSGANTTSSLSYSSNTHSDVKKNVEIKKEVPKSKDSDQFRALFGEIIKKGSVNNTKTKDKSASSSTDKKDKSKSEVGAAADKKSSKSSKSPSEEKYLFHISSL
ncbi:Protein AF-9 [Armadillidium nasatum]|uniref:Protein AF-9 n=1 Tax=Armadillidium nasatum TaxID=96803 RepID=A0A5N5TMC4_9CRUS|nr:Protein AF-9 [Armadillidium nasatum]